MSYLILIVGLFVTFNYLKSASQAPKMQKVRVEKTRTRLRSKS